MRNKISVLIPDGEDDRALIVVRSLAYSKNVKIYVISSEYKSVHLSIHCHFIKIKSNSDDDRLKQIIETTNRKKVNVLLPIGQKGIQFIHSNFLFLKEFFRIPPVPGRNEFDTVRNKWSLNEYCRENSISFLKSVLVKKRMYKKSDLSDFSGPVLLKPFLGEGGLGIHFFKNIVALLEELNLHIEYYASNGYVIQEYIEGKVVSFSAFCQSGEMLAYTIHQPAGKNNRSLVFAKIIEFVENDKVFKFAKDFLLKLKWDGMANMDLILNREGSLYVLDFNPRYFGTMLGTTVSGVNYPYLACLKAMNIPFSSPDYKKIVFGIYNGREMLTWLKDKKSVDSVPFKHTNLRFILKDPAPAIILGLKQTIT